MDVQVGVSSSIQAAEHNSTKRFDWIMIVVCSWMLVGGYMDGWAHNHFALDTFFTPWHGVMYTGLLAVGIFLGSALLFYHARGYSWLYALPKGYNLSLFGFLLTLIAGVGDMIWHLLFGIEVGINGALSPTHMLLIIGGVLILGGPLRAAWQRPDCEGVWFIRLRAYLPMLLSITYVFSLITVLTEYFQPVVFTWAAQSQRTSNPFFGQAIGVSSILLQTALLMGLVLLALRRWQLPPGALTVIVTLNTILLSFMHDTYILIPAALLGGVAADILVILLHPSVSRPVELRIFAFAMPTLFYCFYFLDLYILQGIWWSIHLWMGSMVVAGIVGFMLSYLLVPPPLPNAGQIEQIVRDQE